RRKETRRSFLVPLSMETNIVVSERWLFPSSPLSAPINRILVTPSLEITSHVGAASGCSTYWEVSTPGRLRRLTITPAYATTPSTSTSATEKTVARTRCPPRFFLRRRSAFRLLALLTAARLLLLE